MVSSQQQKTYQRPNILLITLFGHPVYNIHWLGDSFCIQLNCRPPIKVVSETVDVSSCAFWPARTRQTQTHTYYMNHCTIVTKDHIAIVKIGQWSQNIFRNWFESSNNHILCIYKWLLAV